MQTSDATTLTGESDSLPAPKLYRELSRKGKVWRVVAVAFAILHLGATLLGGAIAPIKRVFNPVFGFYSDGLRMANAWGMFGKAPNSTHVVMEGVTADGRTYVLSTTDPHDRPFFDRVRDARMRKFQGKLAEENDRARLGGPFLDYYCRLAREHLPDVRDVRIRNILHQTRDDTGRVTREASTVVLLVRRCGAAGPPIAPPAAPNRAPRPPQEGGDM